MSLRNLIILLLFPMAAWGQKDTSAFSFRNQFLPTGIRIGTDLIPPIRQQIDDHFSGWEMNADVDFNRYYLNVEYGQGGLNYNQYNEILQRDTLRYRNNGNYWRTGIDVNFLTRDPDRNMFFLGARYGRSRFNESFYVEDKAIWGSKTETYTNDNVSAHWYELTMGLRVKIWKYLWMGYTGRFKFGLKTGDTPELLPYDVPGYGRTDKETTYGFSYLVMIRIPVRPLPPLPPKKKKKK